MTYNFTRILILMVVVVFLPVLLGFVEHFFFVRRYHQRDRDYSSIFEVLSGSRLASYAVLLDGIAFYLYRSGVGLATELSHTLIFGFIIIVHFQLFLLSLIVERKFHHYKVKEITSALGSARGSFLLGLLALLTNGFIVTVFVGIGDLF